MGVTSKVGQLRTIKEMIIEVNIRDEIVKCKTWRLRLS